MRGFANWREAKKVLLHIVFMRALVIWLNVGDVATKLNCMIKDDRFV